MPSGERQQRSAWVAEWRHALVVAAGLHAQQAPALQLVEASDGVAVEALISTKDPTRIRIEGASITDVFGSIHSSHCAVPSTGAGSPVLPVPPTALTSNAPVINPSGEVVVECDREKGEIYIRPVGAGDKPINLFLASANATYTLVMRRADVPADTIVIRDRTLRSLRASAQGQPRGVPPGPAPSHVRAMKSLLVAMASDHIPADVFVEDMPRTVQLLAQTRFSLLRRYEGRNLIGELYALENIGAAPMTLAEREFDLPPADSSAGGEVAGVAIEHYHLRPGESTKVYVLRRGDAR